MWEREDFTVKRALIAAGCAIVAFGIFWCVRDVWAGEWRAFPATVTGKQFVPDRSHWEVHVSSDAKGRASTNMVYVSVPAEYHVFVVEPSGDPGDFNDAWAFSNLAEHQRCQLRARVGRSGWRWYTRIEHTRHESSGS
jgi:hypothetical protein